MFTAILTFLQSALGLLDQLGPALNAFILSDIPAHEQAEMNRRIRRCRHICRVQHLNRADIVALASVDFSDFAPTKYVQLGNLIADELHVAPQLA